MSGLATIHTRPSNSSVELSPCSRVVQTSFKAVEKFEFATLREEVKQDWQNDRFNPDKWSEVPNFELVKLGVTFSGANTAFHTVLCESS